MLSSADSFAMSSARVTWIALTRALLLGLLFVTGCMAPQHGATAPIDDGYDYDEQAGGGGGYGDYGGVEAEYRWDAAESTVAPGSTAAPSMDVEARREYANTTVAPPPTPPVDPTSLPTGKLGVDLPTQTDLPKQAANKRQVIYTATMQVQVYDVEHSIAQAEALPDRFGGWLHQRVDNQLVLRIPAEHLREAMEIIEALGVVDYRLLEALDVTAQYTDLESRIAVLAETHAQLSKLLAEAKTVEQALEIRNALDQVTLELELARARMRELSKAVAFSTLIVQFVARGPDFMVPSSNDPFTWVVELGVEATEYR